MGPKKMHDAAKRRSPGLPRSLQPQRRIRRVDHEILRSAVAIGKQRRTWKMPFLANPQPPPARPPQKGGRWDCQDHTQ
jgi:hypothetical protein